MTGYAIKLLTSGEVELVDVSGVEDDKHLPWYYEQIGCDMIEIVCSKYLPENCVMVVDEEALLKEYCFVNFLASWLYGVMDHGQPICGDVLIMREVWTEEGADIDGIPEDEAKAFAEGIENEWPMVFFRVYEKLGCPGFMSR